MSKTINLLVLLIIMFSASGYAQSNQSQSGQSQQNQSQSNQSQPIQQKSPSDVSVKRTKWNNKNVDRSSYRRVIVKPEELPLIDFQNVSSEDLDAFVRGKKIICNDTKRECYVLEQDVALRESGAKIAQVCLDAIEKEKKKRFDQECDRLVKLEKQRIALFEQRATLSSEGKSDPKIDNDIENIRKQVWEGLKLLQENFGEDSFKEARKRVNDLFPRRK